MPQIVPNRTACLGLSHTRTAKPAVSGCDLQTQPAHEKAPREGQSPAGFGINRADSGYPNFASGPQAMTVQAFFSSIR